jgi:hypothetical protein
MSVSLVVDETLNQAVNRFSAGKFRQGYKFQDLHEYVDENGKIIYFRIRLKHPNGEKWIRPMYKDPKLGYDLKEPPYPEGTLKPLYGLALLKKFPDAVVFIVEGEYPADKLNEFFIKQEMQSKHIAITSGSATSANTVNWEPLTGKTCILWPDNDESGVRYSNEVSVQLLSKGCKLECIDEKQLGLPDKGDCIDWFEANPQKTINDILDLPRSQVDQLENIDVEMPHSSQATDLVVFITERTDLFHDENKVVYCIDKVSKEVRSIEGRQFRDFITASYYENTGKTVRDQALREALATLSGIGRYKGECLHVNRRVAKYGESYYLDLCIQGNSRAIQISASSWCIIDEPPVRFVRSDTMEALPEPILTIGDITKLWDICNIPIEAQLLTLAWLAEMLRPETPYPVLELVGEQGSAKSTTQTFLRRIFDPNSCDLRAAPKNPEDMYVSAGANYLMSYENISHLSSPMQDALCVISTGGGHAKRKLYADADETVIQVKNPIIINGITPSITAQDLIDRTVTIELPVITERTETNHLKSVFESEHAHILGGLLNIVSQALKLLPNVNLPANERPRLYEFARFGIALAEASGFNRDKFMQQFNHSRQESLARTIDAHPVAVALIEWAEARVFKTEELSAKVLFTEVEQYRPDHTADWPRSPKGFADALRRASSALRQWGIECKCLGKRGSYVMWGISVKEKS